MLHYKFVRIHPFDDGNGRVSRLLMNYVLLKNGLPPVIIKSADKRNYLSALHFADIGDYEPLIEYIAQQVVWSLDISIRAAKGINIEENEAVEKKIILFKKSLNRNNERKKARSNENIKFILQNAGIRLFTRSINAFKEFDDLFHEKEYRFIFSDQEHISYNANNRSGGRLLVINNKFPESFLDWLDKTTFDFFEFGLEIYWSGYKLSTPPFSIGVYINFKFDKYTYHISRTTSFNDKDHYIEHFYDKQLTEDDINFTASQIANDIMEEIKNNHFNE